MCGMCGCSGKDVIINGDVLSRPHVHDHEHGNGDDHQRHSRTSSLLEIEHDVLSKNDGFAAANRSRFARDGILALNLVSSPGAGKTTLLTQTVSSLMGRVDMAVIEGDQQTDNDARRIRETGVTAIQINTGRGCHLDAHMVGHAVDECRLAANGILFIENVGNLVCPAAFDLGERHKVAILSVTEGEDKPLKYPDMFAASDLMILNKCDLLPYLDFDIKLSIEFARRVNPDIEVIELSARSGQGMDLWKSWILDHFSSHDAADKQAAPSTKGAKTQVT